MVAPRALTAAVAAFLLLGACGPTSKVDPKAGVTVHATVQRPDGAPAADVPVVLLRETGAAELIGGFFLASFTVFTACLADPPPAVCRAGLRRTDMTDSGGTATFHLAGKDTQGTFGTASSFSLGAQFAPGDGELAGPTASLGFRIQKEDLTLPPLREWRPTFTLTAPNKARWDKVGESGYGSGSGYRLAFETTTGTPVWAFDTDATALTFDPRLLEDSRGGVTVAAKRRLDVNANYTSGRLPYAGSTGAPPSRAKPCLVDGAPTAPCPLTDGDFQKTLDGRPHTAAVDLGAPAPINLVAVRGCGGCTVETSNDGATWSRLAGPLDKADIAVDPPRATTARYVQVSSSSEISGLRELSVW